jgi:hypothetical protein
MEKFPFCPFSFSGKPLSGGQKQIGSRIVLPARPTFKARAGAGFCF